MITLLFAGYLSPLVAADFLTDFQEAYELREKRAYADAFTRLAANAVGDRRAMLVALDTAVGAGKEHDSVRGNYIYLTPALMRANEAIVDQDYDTALQVLGTMRYGTGSWACRVQEAYGDLYAARGDNVKAVECYRHALAEDNVREAIRQPVCEKLALLCAE